MTTRLSQSRTGSRGFTLVELLVVITVIGILVGMLAVAIIPALQRGKEFAIQAEMKQIEQSIENFRNDKNFYPPSFEGLTFAQFRSYVNQMAPNNRETADGRLMPWWDNIGQFIDQESSLVFWLSGTFENQQYPITGGSPAGTIIAAHSFGADPPTVGARKVYYDFQTGQLFGDQTDESVEYTVGTTPTEVPAALRATAAEPGIILEYMQEHGRSMDGRPSMGSDLLFKYRDAASYAAAGAYHTGPVATPSYINPNTFQLVCFGLDGSPGATNGAGVNASASDLSSEGEDNLCNFANGRIRLWLTANGQ